MAIGIALAAEEHGKIVSAQYLCNAVKSYLPTHGTFHKIVHCALCIFADAIRKECAEAKSGNDWFVFPVFRALRNFSGETRMLWRIFSARIIPLKRRWYFQSLLQGDFLYCFVIFRRSGQIWHRLRAFPPGEALWL